MLRVEHRADRFTGCLVIRPGRKEILPRFFHCLFIHGKFLFRRALLHPCLNGCRVLPGQLKQQTLQVGRNQNIHAGGCGFIQFPAAIVDSCFKKTAQHIVLIARAN